MVFGGIGRSRFFSFLNLDEGPAGPPQPVKYSIRRAVKLERIATAEAEGMSENSKGDGGHTPGRWKDIRQRHR